MLPVTSLRLRELIAYVALVSCAAESAAVTIDSFDRSGCLQTHTLQGPPTHTETVL